MAKESKLLIHEADVIQPWGILNIDRIDLMEWTHPE